MILTHCNLPFILNYKLNLLYCGSVCEHDILWASISFDGLPWKLERKKKRTNTFVSFTKESYILFPISEKEIGD